MRLEEPWGIFQIRSVKLEEYYLTLQANLSKIFKWYRAWSKLFGNERKMLLLGCCQQGKIPSYQMKLFVVNLIAIIWFTKTSYINVVEIKANWWMYGKLTVIRDFKLKKQNLHFCTRYYMYYNAYTQS